MQSEANIIKANRPRRGGIKGLLLSPEVSILIPLIVLSVITGIINPKFLSWGNFSVILRYSTFIGVVAIGQAVVIMSGEIDLSVGANACFSGIIFGVCAITYDLGFIPSALIAMLAGGLIGFINGYLVASFGLVNFITTLATMFLCHGLAITISGGEPIAPLPDAYFDFALLRPLNLSWLFFIMLGILIITEIVMRFTTIGRKVKATGGNKEAALMGGINIKRVKWGAYIFSGVLAGICGILYAVELSAASPESGIGLEFRTITACAVGGISLMGGEGSILGVGIGFVLLMVLANCLQLLKVESNWQLVIIGAILIGAVLFDLAKKRVQAKSEQ